MDLLHLFQYEVIVQVTKDQVKLIELENVNRRYTLGDHTVDALNNINLTVYKEEFIMVMGPSGSGKSTLINVMAGLEAPSAGTVRIHESDLSTLKDRELCNLRRHKLGFVFQFFNQILSNRH